MINKDELDSRLKMNIYEYYNCNQYSIYDESYSGAPVTVNKKSLQLPQLIVKQLLSTTLAEGPQINIKGSNGDETIESPISLKEAMHDILAYGETFIAPSLYDNDNVIFEILTIKNNKIKYYKNEVGELTYIYYEKKYENFNAAKGRVEEISDKIEWINDKSNDIIINNISKSIDSSDYNTITTTYPYNEAEKLMPRRFYMKGTGVNGKAIYYDAINYINDYDDTLNDNFDDRDLSKSVLLVPEHMVESNIDVSDDGSAKIDDKYLGYKKIFRIMPGDEQDSKPIEWRGGWNPDNYIKHINYLLHLISLHSGLGSRFLSYDSTGGLKTATEIVSEKDDLYKTKKNIDAIVDEIVRWGVDVESLLLGKNIIIDNIKYYDGLIEDDSKKRENYFQDYTNGAIDVETYLELTGYDIDTINKVKSRMFNAKEEQVNEYPEDNKTGSIGFEV